MYRNNNGVAVACNAGSSIIGEVLVGKLGFEQGDLPADYVSAGNVYACLLGANIPLEVFFDPSVSAEDQKKTKRELAAAFEPVTTAKQ